MHSTFARSAGVLSEYVRVALAHVKAGMTDRASRLWPTTFFDIHANYSKYSTLATLSV